MKRNAMMVGERVYLRPFEVEDGREFALASVREQSTMADRGRVPISPLAFDHWYTTPRPPGPPPVIDFVVCRKDDHAAVGTVALLDIDWVNRTAETASFLLGEEVRGKGYGTEAKRLLLEFAFDRLHLHALRSHVWEPNERSAAALAKQGYQPAGRLRWTEVKGGEYRDSLIFDLLRDDWLASR